MRISQKEPLKDVKARRIDKVPGGWMTGKIKAVSADERGMELVQVAILVALAVGLGLIFKSRITEFVTATFDGLMSAGF